ncbi:hypothetical protein KCP73_13395 [Salmonella enterica subsp. enterica]|nr:hypothetical protein KCP73_13395 [Salmonella enterica subsp. enterica]
MKLTASNEYRDREVMAKTFVKRGLDPAQIPVVLVHSHRPVCPQNADAVHNAVRLRSAPIVVLRASFRPCATGYAAEPDKTLSA